MDKVQIYYTCILVLYVFVSGLQHGKPKTGDHNSTVDIVSLLFSLPVIGRIFNWW